MPRLIAHISSVGLGLAVAGSAVAPAIAAEAEPARVVDLTYEVYLGGLQIFTFNVDMTLQPDRYRVTAEGATQGMVGWMYDWNVRLAAEGAEEDGRIAPRSYLSESEWQSDGRSLRLGFDGDGRYDLQQMPAPEPDPDIEGGLPESLPEGTVDPLSMAVAASRALEAQGSCDQTLPVFDGQRRYDLIVTQVDRATLEPNEYSIYHGPAVRCSFKVERISGFRKSWQARRGASVDAAPPLIWMASLRPDLPPVPVRYDGQIALGNIVVHLTAAEVRGPADDRPAQDTPFVTDAD